MAYIVCTSNLNLVSFLFVPALYSTLKLEIFPFTCIRGNGETDFCLGFVAKWLVYWYSSHRYSFPFGMCCVCSYSLRRNKNVLEGDAAVILPQIQESPNESQATLQVINLTMISCI